MDVDDLMALCAAKPGAWPDHPWEDHAFPVYKVGEGERGKIFAFVGREQVGVKAATTREAADESYRLVASGLPRRLRPDGWDA